MSAIIGDGIHNLHAALDLLATELAIVGGGTGKDVYFPFNADPSKFETKWLRCRMKGADDRALRFIKRLKPYPGGNETLWTLHQLDILDKHKAIIPVGAAHRSVAFDLGSLIPAGSDELSDHMRKWLRKTPIFIRPADREYPLQDGTVLFSCTIPKPDGPQSNPQFRIEIAFGEGQIVDGQPIIRTLEQFIQLVERITKIAERHFF